LEGLEQNGAGGEKMKKWMWIVLGVLAFVLVFGKITIEFGIEPKIFGEETRSVNSRAEVAGTPNSSIPKSSKIESNLIQKIQSAGNESEKTMVIFELEDESYTPAFKEYIISQGATNLYVADDLVQADVPLSKVIEFSEYTGITYVRTPLVVVPGEMSE